MGFHRGNSTEARPIVAEPGTPEYAEVERVRAEQAEAQRKEREARAAEEAAKAPSLGFQRPTFEHLAHDEGRVSSALGIKAEDMRRMIADDIIPHCKIYENGYAIIPAAGLAEWLHRGAPQTPGEGSRILAALAHPDVAKSKPKSTRKATGDDNASD